jgi:N-acetylmuramoyl-L-alanine amidase
LQNQNITDIPFNFLIGGDGKTYELRGWNYRSGFDQLPFNSESITVGLIGDFTCVEPVENQVQEVNAFISESIRRRKLISDYKIHGARLHESDGHKMFKKFKSMEEWVGWI